MSLKASAAARIPGSAEQGLAVVEHQGLVGEQEALSSAQWEEMDTVISKQGAQRGVR